MPDKDKMQIVSPQEWADARSQLLLREKEATKLLQDLAKARRALPLVQIANPERFKFDDPVTNQEKTLSDLFDGRKQLILYHFMLGPSDKEGCSGCSFLMDNIPAHLEHLWHKNTTFVAVAPASTEQITQYFKERMGWTFPVYSSAQTQQAWKDAEDSGNEVITWKPGNGYFGINIFIRNEKGEIFHSYGTTDRGCEAFLSTYHLLDMTPLGRQEKGKGMDVKLRDQYT